MQNEPTISASVLLSQALRDDPEYAWAWHCNIAMPIKDALCVTHEQANRAAARLMQHLFGVDITKDERFIGFIPAWERPDAE